MWVVMLAIIQQATTSMAIRLVDPWHTALPGMALQVTRVDDCVDMAHPVLVAGRVTDFSGAVEVPGVSRGAYLITTSGDGGFETARECVEVSGQERAYVQVTIRPDLALQMSTHREEGLAGDVAKAPLGALTGVYRDRRGRLYGVSLAGGRGLEVSLPGGRRMRFSERRGRAFIGDDGRLDFRIEQGRVALVITPAIVRAVQQVEAGH